MSPKIITFVCIVFLFSPLFAQIFANWIYDASFRSIIGHDDNVLVSADSANNKEETLFLSTSINLNASYKKTTGNFFSASYKPLITHYFGLDQDDHLTHTSILKFKRSTSSDFTIKGSLLYKFIDGDTLTPEYTETAPTFLGGLATRDRHKSVISRQALNMQWNISDRSLIQLVFDGYYHDFQTTQFDANDSERPNGYINYVDRSIFNGGMNFGYKFIGDAYLTIGYRYGVGIQDNRPGTDLEYSNHFHRILLGIRGKVNEVLSFDFLTGPEIKEFNGQTTEGFDNHRTFWFAKGSAQIDFSELDTLKISVSRMPLQSYLGASIYEDFKVVIDYSKNIRKSLSASTTLTRYEGDWVSGQEISRNDLLWSPAIVLKYHARENLLFECSYTHESTHSVVAEQEFKRTLITFGTQFLF